MKVTKTKTIITLDEKEYEIIRTFCEILTDNENEIYSNMGGIIEGITYGGKVFNDFSIEIE